MFGLRNHEANGVRIGSHKSPTNKIIDARILDAISRYNSEQPIHMHPDRISARLTLCDYTDYEPQLGDSQYRYDSARRAFAVEVFLIFLASFVVDVR